eukprot:1151160-Pelagomonas_calceolata.AAC.3
MANHHASNMDLKSIALSACVLQQTTSTTTAAAAAAAAATAITTTAAAAAAATTTTAITLCTFVPLTRLPPPPGMLQRIDDFEGVAYARFEPPPYDGDLSWLEDF